MDYNLKEEQVKARNNFKDFAEKHIKPLAIETDKYNKFPRETVNELAKLGYLGIAMPKEYGGLGWDALSYTMCIEEFAKICVSTSTIVAAHSSLCSTSILDWANEELKQKYLIPLAKGELLGAFGLTEPGAGSDVAVLQTKAVKDGDNYILNGAKVFITNAGQADVYVIFAMTDKKIGPKGMSAFIVEKDFSGFSIGKKENKLGIHGSDTCELIMENCIVPKENLIGKEGIGFRIAMQSLDGGRIGVAAQALGAAEGAFEETLDYLKNNYTSEGKSLIRSQSTQFRLAEIATKIEASRHLIYKAAFKKENKEKFMLEAAMAKYFATEVGNEIVRTCVDLQGMYGCSFGTVVERALRDVRITEIYEGTNEIQKIIIFNEIVR